MAAGMAVAALLSAAAAFSPQAPPAAHLSPAGDWIATLDFGPVKTRLALHIAGGAGGSWTALADSIDQDAFGLAVARLRIAGRALEFEVPRIGGRFSGQFAPGGSAIDGVWKQRGGRLPMRFDRGNIRPQEPSPPYPYAEERIVARNGPVRLAGTLTLPRQGSPHPAVVLLTGSGPQDRNDTVSGHRPFLVWADFLTRRGIAVLRMDDRGVGESTGRLLDSTDEDFAADALAAVSVLKARRDIDGRRIGLLGHSEGAAVAPLAASRSHDIAFLVLLAAPTISGERILYTQAERIPRVLGIPDAVAARNRQIEAKLLAAARSAPDGTAARREMQAVLARETRGLPPEAAAAIRGQAESQMSTAASRWFRFTIDYDPAPALAKTACPVLSIYGSLDLQVPPDLNAPAMERALAGNPHHRVVTLPGLNHMLQTARTGSPVEYSEIEETVAPRVLAEVGDWLAGILGTGVPAGGPTSRESR
jgi:uncharacterized protein